MSENQQNSKDVERQEVVVEDYHGPLKDWPLQEKGKEELMLPNANQITTTNNPPDKFSFLGSDRATRLAGEAIICSICAAALLLLVTGIEGVMMGYTVLRWIPILLVAVLLILSFFSIVRSISAQSQSASPGKVFILNGVGLILATTISAFFIINIPFFVSPMQF